MGRGKAGGEAAAWRVEAAAEQQGAAGPPPRAAASERAAEAIGGHQGRGRGRGARPRPAGRGTRRAMQPLPIHANRMHGTNAGRRGACGDPQQKQARTLSPRGLQRLSAPVMRFIEHSKSAEGEPLAVARPGLQLLGRLLSQGGAHPCSALQVLWQARMIRSGAAMVARPHAGGGGGTPHGWRATARPACPAAIPRLA